MNNTSADNGIFQRNRSHLVVSTKTCTNNVWGKYSFDKAR